MVILKLNLLVINVPPTNVLHELFFDYFFGKNKPFILSKLPKWVKTRQSMKPEWNDAQAYNAEGLLDHDYLLLYLNDFHKWNAFDETKWTSFVNFLSYFQTPECCNWYMVQLTLYCLILPYSFIFKFGQKLDLGALYIFNTQNFSSFKRHAIRPPYPRFMELVNTLSIIYPICLLISIALLGPRPVYGISVSASSNPFLIVIFSSCLLILIALAILICVFFSYKIIFTKSNFLRFVLSINLFIHISFMFIFFFPKNSTLFFLKEIFVLLYNFLRFYRCEESPIWKVKTEAFTFELPLLSLFKKLVLTFIFFLVIIFLF